MTIPSNIGMRIKARNEGEAAHLIDVHRIRGLTPASYGRSRIVWEQVHDRFHKEYVNGYRAGEEAHVNREA